MLAFTHLYRLVPWDLSCFTLNELAHVARCPGHQAVMLSLQASCYSQLMSCKALRKCFGMCASRKTLVSDAARELEKSKMARFDEKSGNLYVTELGRVASHFYIKHSSIVIYNDLLKRHMSEAEVCNFLAGARRADKPTDP